MKLPYLTVVGKKNKNNNIKLYIKNVQVLYQHRRTGKKSQTKNNENITIKYIHCAIY